VCSPLATPLFVIDGWLLGRGDIVSSESGLEALDRSREDVRRLAGRLLSFKDEERCQLARELQEALGPHVDALIREGEELRDAPESPAGGADPGSSRAARIDSLVEKLDSLGIEVRQLVHRLHPAAVESYGLAHALARLGEDLRRNVGLDVQLLVEQGVEPLPEDVARAFYRIAQEGLRNVVRHAGVLRALVAVRGRDEAVVLSVADAGAGFALDAPRSGLGLLGMEERVRQVGGGFRVESAPGRGTEIEASVPRGAALPATAPGPVLRRTAAVGANRCLGPYRLLEVLGQGPAATVYRVEHTAQPRRDLTLKLFHHHLADDRDLLRFQAEQRPLTRLSHPAIARVEATGLSEKGELYLVTEAVSGSPLTEYCDQRRLSLTERLALFATVCRALQDAHERGILHRNLRPSNVLVREEGGHPWPCLVDFGVIARREPASVSSPYLSPEVRAGQPGDVRSDVYSLGVLLYQLVVGILPDPDSVSPARALAELPPAAAIRIAKARRGDLASLSWALGGDLEWVLLEALAPDPARRYASAAELAGEIEHLLDGRPVKAGPPGAIHRLFKFIRRHRVAVAATALLIFSLLAGIAGTTGQARRAAREAERANREAMTAERVVGFLSDLFQRSDPAVAQGTELTARELLDRGAHRLQDDLEAEPLVRARLQSTIGEIYEKLGLYQEAEPLLAKALETRRQILGEEHPDVASSLHALATLSVRAGDFSRAEPLFRRALALREQAPKPVAADIATTLNNLGVLLASQGRFEEARALLDRCLAIRIQDLGEEDPEVARTLNNLAGIELALGETGKAERLLLRGLAIREKILASEHPDIAANLVALALTHEHQGRYQDAEALYQRALGIWEKTLGPEHPQVALVLGNLGIARSRQGHFAAAEEVLKRSLAIREKTLAPDHPDLAFSLVALADLYRTRGRLAAAVPLYERALALWEHTLAPDHPDRIAAVQACAEILRELGREKEAAALEERHGGTSQSGSEQGGSEQRSSEQRGSEQRGSEQRGSEQRGSEQRGPGRDPSP